MDKKLFAIGNAEGVQKAICKSCGSPMTKKEVVKVEPEGVETVTVYWVCITCRKMELA